MPLSPFQTVVDRITAVCAAAAPCSLLSDLRERLERQGVPAAVAARDTPALYDWLMPTLSYQGVSDAVAWGYMDRYGSVTHAEVAAALVAEPACPRLRCYWTFAECGFAKSAYTCGSREHLDGCPVPRHDLRNGRLNQTAYSLALFLRDVCDGDFVAWLDRRLLAADVPGGPDRAPALRSAVLEPLSGIYGVSAKVWSMALADLLLAGDPGRERWRAAGAGMIAVDTLVHNWMHRSGCLTDLGPITPMDRAATPQAGVPASSKPRAERSTPAVTALKGRPPSPVSSRRRSGSSAPRVASTSAMATASTTAGPANRSIARSLTAANACPCAREPRHQSQVVQSRSSSPMSPVSDVTRVRDPLSKRISRPLRPTLLFRQQCAHKGHIRLLLCSARAVDRDAIADLR